ncbi:MAG: nitrite reductase small subunit NirD [Phycisphaera sp.]|nr:nitrite reductase small subunit NirD [Phycisphaera sp.]
MVMSDWQPLCDLTAIPHVGGHYVVHHGRPLAVFRHNGEVIVMDDTCPHAGGSLSAGRIDGESRCVLCPWHGWPFELATGQCPDNPTYRVQHYEVKVEDHRVYVR